MFKSLQKSIASIVLLSLWLNIAGLSLGIIAQESKQQEKTEKTQKDNNKKQKEEKKNQQKESQSNKTLSEKEDPSMIGKRNINKGDGFFAWLGGSKENEIKIGRQLATQIEQEVKIVDDPLVSEYINRVGQNLVLHSDAKIPFTIKVVEDDEVNAFSIPGGFLYVNTGLILATDNEAELASVMAHEIAHVAARHAIENYGKARLLSAGILAGIIFGGPITSTILQNAGGLGEGLAYLHFSRGAEIEADMLGAQYLYAAGYDPTAMATMFEKLAAQNRKKPNSVKRLFSTHPPSLERRDKVLSLISKFPEKQEYIVSTSEFQRVKEHLMRLTNAKAIALANSDQDNSRPTLKRRQPDTTNPDEKKDDQPPQLKRRSPEPTPSPNQNP
jgi:predicted Zn-dependent protease